MGIEGQVTHLKQLLPILNFIRNKKFYSQKDEYHLKMATWKPYLISEWNEINKSELFASFSYPFSETLIFDVHLESEMATWQPYLILK